MDDSREPFLVQFIHTPLTALTSLALLLIWFPLWNNRVPADKVAFSYKRVLEDREYWRVFTAAFAHLEFFHLFFNMTSLWSCRAAELYYGSWSFLMLSLALVVASKLITLGIYHMLITRFALSRYLEQLSVGYSAVIFGWMTVLSFLTPVSARELCSSRSVVSGASNERVQGNVSVMGFLEMPGPLAPFFSLLLTQILVRSASFIGHFAGILAGYLVLFGAFSFLRGAYWTICSIFWIVVIVIASIKATTSLPVPCIDYVNYTAPDINSMAREEGDDEEVEEELLLQGLAPNSDGSTAVLV